MACPTNYVDHGASYAPFHRDGAYVLRPSAPMSWPEFESARHAYGCTVNPFALPDEAAAHASRFGLTLEVAAR